jgi:choice-of-anchor A domain-containing protein
MVSLRIATKNICGAKFLTLLRVSFVYCLTLSVNFANAAPNTNGFFVDMPGPVFTDWTEQNSRNYVIAKSKTFYQALAHLLSGLPVSEQVADEWDELYFNGDCTDIKAMNSFDVRCIPNNIRIIFNFEHIIRKNRYITRLEVGVLAFHVPSHRHGRRHGRRHAPTAENAHVVTKKNTMVAITLKATDKYDAPLSYYINKQVQHGTLTGTAGNYQYRANADFVGIDHFTYRVNNGERNSKIANIYIRVLAENGDYKVLGNATAFSAYVFSNFNAKRSDVEGALAVGGNLILRRYDVATDDDFDPLAYSLLVEGNARYSRGRIRSGKVRIAGNISGIRYGVINSLPVGTTIENEPLNYSIKASKPFYQTLANSLSVLPVNGKVTKRWRGLYLQGDCSSPLQVFKLNSAALKKIHTFDVKCIPDDATVIFNITGRHAVFKRHSLSTLTKHRNRVIFNFYQAKRLRLSRIDIEGVILAPNAHIKANNGAVKGTVIAKSWKGTMQLSNIPFIGDVRLDHDNADRDGDGVADDEDAFPDDPTETVDSDGDGVGDNSDAFPNDATETLDSDGDGVGDNSDAFPNDATETLDSDGDGVGNNSDAFPNDATETLDSDGDGVGDKSDAFPNNPAETLDSDGDGIGDNSDAFPNNPAETLDSDGDGIGDNSDAFPNNPAETLDTDGDGIGDNSDAFPNDAAETLDSDGDGIGDNSDAFPNDATETLDSDGDGVGDNSDAFPNDATETLDSDGDGVGDNSDLDIDGDGFTNVVEQQKGTDPRNAEDFPDTVKPQLVLNSISPLEVENDFFNVSGTTTDTVQPYSGIKLIAIGSDQYPEASFTGSYDDNTGVFAIEVPLKALKNVIKVVAQDHSGNVVYAELVINREPAPAFINIVPHSGSITTKRTTTIRGEIYSILPVSALTLRINEWQLSPKTTNKADVYAFSIPDIKLEYGINTFNLVVQSTSNKQAQKVLNINYTADNAEEIAPPKITLNSPSANALLNQEIFRLSALIESSAGPLTVALNGNRLIDAADGITRYNVNELVTFNGAENSTTVTIKATDSLQKITDKVVTFYRDTSGPVIVLDTPLTPSVANNVSASPYVMNGTVSDDNLASILFNDQPVTLQPSGLENTYAFSVTIPIASQTTLPVSIVAYDRSGNKTTQEYQLRNEATATLVPLLPAPNTEYINTGEPIAVQVAARINGLVGDETVTVQFLADNTLSDPVTLVINGELASGMLSLPAVTSEMTIIISLHSQRSELITQSKIAVKVTSSADVPIAVARMEPLHNSAHIEPYTPIEIYFNREIDLSLVSVQVRETLHGKSYVNEDDLGIDFIRSEGYTLVDVHRDLKPVQGTTELSPGGKGVAFYADRAFGFKAKVYIDVMYDGNEISRSTFTVRELPTLINGAVADQFGQPVVGVNVELPELGRKTKTNTDGGFAFGYQESGEQTIPSGQYTLLINNSFTSPYLGTVSTPISVQRNYGNNLKRFTLHELNRNIAFQHISSGKVNNLVGGDLTLDLSHAKVLFDQGRTEGAVHVQFLPFEHIGATLWPSAMPLWLYGIQPKGIQVEGNVNLTLKIPRHAGSYQYLNAAAYPYVVLLGYNSEQQVVEPIGVGRVENHQVVSEGVVNLSSLDYIGYAQVLPKFAETLASFAQGDLSIQQLKAQLQTVLSQED